jgi:hypothetical protein
MWEIIIGLAVAGVFLGLFLAIMDHDEFLIPLLFLSILVIVGLCALKIFDWAGYLSVFVLWTGLWVYLFDRIFNAS